MPQCSDEILEEYMRLGGAGPEDDEFALNYLTVHGWRLTPGLDWIPPAGVESADQVTNEEAVCIEFLAQEWDYGGVNCPLEFWLPRDSQLRLQGVPAVSTNEGSSVVAEEQGPA